MSDKITDNLESEIDDLKSDIKWSTNGVRLGWVLVFVGLFNDYFYELLKGNDWSIWLYFMGIFFIVMGTLEQTIERLKLIQTQNDKIISKLYK